jgi:hypothetical protein
MKIVGFFWIILAAVAMWTGEAWAQAGGVFQGGQKFVTMTTVSTNCGTIAIPGPHQILEITPENSSATFMVLHLYDIASTPVAGALAGQIGAYLFPTEASGQGMGLPVNLGALGASVNNGIGYCITGGLPLADATNGAVGGVVNWTVK